ncbi:MAG: hypothetical protein HQ546_01990, partial [Planctomycetes bacterium]|nr:hypothetical protein [Planctomycetota bacterium]
MGCRLGRCDKQLRWFHQLPWAQVTVVHLSMQYVEKPAGCVVGGCIAIVSRSTHLPGKLRMLTMVKMFLTDSRRLSKLRWLAILPVVFWVVMTAAGCDKISPKAAAARRLVPGDREVSPEELVEIHRRCLVVVETNWSESSSLLAGRRRQGREGVGVIIASDGRSALVLTSRRMVDPRYDRQGSHRIRDVMFRVSTSAEWSSGRAADARLVAVFMNGADMALLHIGALTREPFAIPVAYPAALQAGDAVTVVGPSRGQGLS